MSKLIYFGFIAVFGITSAQVVPFGPRNVPNGIVAANQIPAPALAAPANVPFNAGKLGAVPLANGLLNENVALANSVAVNNAHLAHDIHNANLALAGASLAGINGNVATFNVGNDAHLFSVTSGSPGSPGYGIQVLADALEVGGTVTVNGQIPIFGTVAVSGNVPTDGTAAVNYSCGRPAVVV